MLHYRMRQNSLEDKRKEIKAEKGYKYYSDLDGKEYRTTDTMKNCYNNQKKCRAKQKSNANKLKNSKKARKDPVAEQVTMVQKA